MKQLLCLIFVCLIASTSWATLGNTKQQELDEQSKADSTVQQAVAPGIEVLVFDYPGGTVFAMVLHGKVVSNTWTRKDDSPIPTEFAVAELSKYSNVWTEIESPLPNTTAARSSDGQTFMIEGESKDMKVKHHFTVFSREWIDYVPGVKI